MMLKKKNINPKTSLIECIESRKDFKELGIRRNFTFETGFKIKSFKKTEGQETRRILKGYASTTDKDRTDDIITLGALTKAKDDLIQQGSRTVFFNHDRSKPIGKVLTTSLDQKGLIVEALISKAKSVDDYWIQIKEGVLNSLSIGGRFKKVQVERDEEGKVIAFKVLELELMEVSVVGIPMNPKAGIFSAVEKSFRGLVRSNNLSKKARIKMKKSIKKEGVKIEKKDATGLTEDKVKSMIESATTPIFGSVKKMSKLLKKFAAQKEEVVEKKVKVSKEKKMEKKAKKKSAEVVPSWAKSLNDSIRLLSKRMKGKKLPVRKGRISEDKEVDEVEVNDTPKKAFKGFADEASREYAKYVMENPDKYEKLKKSEKESVNATYLCMMDRGTRKK